MMSKQREKEKSYNREEFLRRVFTMAKRDMIRGTVCLMLLIILALFTSGAQEAKPEMVLKNADELFEKKNYKDAFGEYEKFIKTAEKGADWHKAQTRIIMCKLRLSLYEEALKSAEDYAKMCAETPYEARAERLAGNLYMSAPHWGTRAGGEFHRAQHKQGIRLRSEKHDRKKALEHMERARMLYEKYDQNRKALSVLSKKEQERRFTERIDIALRYRTVVAIDGIHYNPEFFVPVGAAQPGQPGVHADEKQDQQQQGDSHLPEKTA